MLGAGESAAGRQQMNDKLANALAGIFWTAVAAVVLMIFDAPTWAIIGFSVCVAYLTDIHGRLREWVSSVGHMAQAVLL
jgi:hypothetical protein